MKYYIIWAIFLTVFIFTDQIDSAHTPFDCKPSKTVVAGKTIYTSADGTKYELSYSNAITTGTNAQNKEADDLLQKVYKGKGFAWPPKKIDESANIRLDSQANHGKGCFNLAIQTNGAKSTNLAGAHGPEHFFEDRGNACDVLQRSLFDKHQTANLTVVRN